MSNLPEPFIARMRQLLGQRADALLEALEQPQPQGLRANTLKVAPEALRALLSWDLEPVPWCPAGYLLPADVRAGRHLAHLAGLFYLQEPSAMAPAELLDIQPGQLVLDLAAAPGGKSTHIASLLGGQGLLIANEIDGGRVRALGENLERWGAPNAIITNETPERLADQLGAIFDRVLLDAPCSGEGMFRKHAAAAQDWSPEHVAGCAVRQRAILDHAAELVRPGGLLLYSTCTFAPEENELQVAEFLDRRPDYALLPLPHAHGIAPGEPGWADGRPELAATARLWPHLLRGAGHFIALLQRRDGPGNVRIPPSSSPKLNAGQCQLWETFAQQALVDPPALERIAARGEQLWLMPKGAPDLGRLRVMRPGLALGSVRPGRFEPAHALALTLGAEDARQQLPLDEAAAQRYLRGETLPTDLPDGWTLLTFAGHGLGWGRAVHGTLKNFYPKGLRVH